MSRNPFKVGDKVKRIFGRFAGMEKGDIDEVVEVRPSGEIKLKKYVKLGATWHDEKNFILFESKREDNEI